LDKQSPPPAGALWNHALFVAGILLLVESAAGFHWLVLILFSFVSGILGAWVLLIQVTRPAPAVLPSS
jgi:hypothetical protein